MKTIKEETKVLDNSNEDSNGDINDDNNVVSLTTSEKELLNQNLHHTIFKFLKSKSVDGWANSLRIPTELDEEFEIGSKTEIDTLLKYLHTMATELKTIVEINVDDELKNAKADEVGCLDHLY